MEEALQANINTLFAFSYDPLKNILSHIVRELSEQKEMLEKIRVDKSYGEEEAYIAGTDEFYNDPP